MLCYSVLLTGPLTIIGEHKRTKANKKLNSDSKNTKMRK